MAIYLVLMHALNMLDGKIVDILVHVSNAKIIVDIWMNIIRRCFES